MPSRIIRESALTSPSLNKLSDFAERLWWRLTAVADDWGMFDADPAVVCAKCFPLRQDEAIRAQVVSALAQLVSVRGISMYTVRRRRYGRFVNWSAYQRTPRGKPKFPSPRAKSAASRGELPQVAAEFRESPQVAGSNRESLVVNRESLYEKRETRNEKRGSGGETPNPFLSSQKERERKEIQDRLRKKGLAH